jgi:hypothetical protein
VLDSDELLDDIPVTFMRRHQLRLLKQSQRVMRVLEVVWLERPTRRAVRVRDVLTEMDSVVEVKELGEPMPEMEALAWAARAT